MSDLPGSCPVCASPVKGRCACGCSHSWCANGHDWHTCVVHCSVVVSKAPFTIDDKSCTCAAGDDGRG